MNATKIEEEIREKLMTDLVIQVQNLVGEGYTVSENTVSKNNGVVLRAVIIHADGENVSSIIYVDDKLDAVREGYSGLPDVAKEVAKIYEENKNPGFADVKNIISRDYILDSVQYKLVNREKNQNLLEKVPHRDFLDLAVLYQTTSYQGEGTASVTVTNDMIKAGSINYDKLERAAHHNTEVCSLFNIMAIEDVLAKTVGCTTEQLKITNYPMYVMGSFNHINGATIMLYDRYFESLAKLLEDDLYILPSSIHEVLAIPATGAKKESLRYMVKSVNENEVTSEEFLSNNVYQYSRKTRKITIAV